MCSFYEIRHPDNDVLLKPRSAYRLSGDIVETASIQNSNEIIPAGIPIVTICGFSNSGKTTLIEKLISNCIDNGLRTAVMKHYQRSFRLDLPVKTQTVFEAGATVFGHDSGQRFIRRHHFEGETVFSDILRLAEDHHDLALIEGHKHISLPGKIWLRRHVNRSTSGRKFFPVFLHDD